MSTLALGLAVIAFVVVVGAWGKYLATIPRGTVPARPVGYVVLQWAGIVLALAAVVWSLRGGGSPGATVIVLAALTLMMASFFLWLLRQRWTPIGDLRVQVGDRFLAFAARASDGTVFHTDSLAGKRTLLKFFRGGW